MKLHIWQTFPEKFTAHEHVYLVIFTILQVAPFKQGFFEHGSESLKYFK